MDEIRVIPYRDYISTLTLWQKAFLLAPIWGIVAIPIAGLLLTAFGEGVAYFGFAILLAGFIARFIEDVLKTKIRIEKDIIFHGYRHYALDQLVSLGLKYKENQMLPTHLVMNFADGRKLSLKLSRLKSTDTEAIVKLVETRFPSVKVDPVLRTLSKCKKLAKSTALDTADRVEIPYNSRQIFKQLLDAFLGTAEKWMRAGPLLCFAVCIPSWLGFFSGLFSSLSLLGSSQTYSGNPVKKGLETAAQGWNSWFGSRISESATVVGDIVANPILATFMAVSLASISYYLLRFALRPNVIMLDKKGMKLKLRLGGINIKVGEVPWANVAHAQLEKTLNSADPDKCKIVFIKKSGKPFKVSLAWVGNENRGRFMKAIERLAPEVTIDSYLSESLIPKQERSYTELWLQSLAAPPDRKSLEPLSPGQLLGDGRYEVIRRLGVGGQGLAYLCRDMSELSTRQFQEVVLKETILPVFVEQAIKQQALERFQKEAEMLEKLDDAHIVKLIDYFIEDHRGYLILEHIDGRNLRQVVEEDGALQESSAQDLALQMAKMLEYLHEKGVIHRDFTPDNLILSRDGTLKLIDFNVAQNALAGSTGTIVGKHAFLPPEQFRGKPTFQSDIYAMGATLHFLVTGKDPEPISESHPSEVAHELSAAFDSLVARCTHLQATKRFADATELKDSVLALGDLSTADGAVISTATAPRDSVEIANALHTITLKQSEESTV